jgi:hypothetical protein
VEEGLITRFMSSGRRAPAAGAILRKGHRVCWPEEVHYVHQVSECDYLYFSSLLIWSDLSTPLFKRSPVRPSSRTEKAGTG